MTSASFTSVSTILSVMTADGDALPEPLPEVDPFLDYIGPILKLEGGLTNTPADRGGVTNFGVTEATARAAGYTGAMAAMNLAHAESIYRANYWIAPGFDKIDPIMPGLAKYLLNVGINAGPGTVSKFLQRALNVMNNQGRLYPAVSVDGRCGLETRDALTAYLCARGKDNGVLVLIGVMRSLAAVHYIQIAEVDPSQAVFVFGWLRNRALGL